MVNASSLMTTWTVGQKPVHATRSPLTTPTVSPGRGVGARPRRSVFDDEAVGGSRIHQCANRLVGNHGPQLHCQACDDTGERMERNLHLLILLVRRVVMPCIGHSLMCARENLTRQLNQRLSSRRYERLKRAPDGERACWPGGGAVADAGVGTEAADEDDAYVNDGARARVGASRDGARSLPRWRRP